MYIESPQNARVREWSLLKTRKGRQQNAAFIVEGIRLVEEALKSQVEIEVLLWDVGTDELPESLQNLASERQIKLVELSPKAFSAVSDTVTSQGVIAIASLPDYVSEELRDHRFPEHALLLDGVQDPGNVGTLMRTADAFGIQEFCCGTGTVDAFSPKVVRASMGGLFRLPVLQARSEDYVHAWKSQWPAGTVVVTAASADEVCYRFDFRRPTLIVLGSEAFGVSEEVVKLADARVRIPMEGMAESLNAAVAGSILIYESFRQRKSQG